VFCDLQLRFYSLVVIFDFVSQTERALFPSRQCVKVQKTLQKGTAGISVFGWGPSQMSSAEKETWCVGWGCRSLAVALLVSRRQEGFFQAEVSEISPCDTS
jgi:hypothetical protein